MFKYIKSILMHQPCEVAKAYIAALEKDPTRIGTPKWVRMKNEIWDHITLKDRVWLREQETKLKQKELIVRMAVLELTNDEPEEDSKALKQFTGGGQSAMGSLNHSILTANQQAAYQQAQMNHNLMAHNYNTTTAPW